MHIKLMRKPNSAASNTLSHGASVQSILNLASLVALQMNE